MHTTFDRARYESLNFPSEVISRMEAMEVESRKDWFAIASAAMSGNERAADLIADTFGIKSGLHTCWAIQTIAADSMTEGELGSYARSAELKLRKYPTPVSNPEAAMKREAEAEAPKLLTLRVKKGLTKAELSRASGVNPRQIYAIERGEIKMGNVSLKNASALAKALGVSTEELLD